MLRVGLTGNIASGKSEVAETWRRLGARVVDADELARVAIAPGTEGHARTVAAFGPGVETPEGAIDRAALREIVFRDAARRAELEAILHPEIERLRTEGEKALAATGARIVVHMIPLLYEVGMADRFDRVVLVDAPESVRRARLIETRHLSGEQADRIMAAQMPAADKRALADIVIENNGSLEDLEARAVAVWKELQAACA